MRNKLENIPRLLLLAEHLRSNKLNEMYSSNQLAYSKNNINLMIGLNGQIYNLFPFVVQELSVLFTEWKLAERGQIIYLPDPSLANNYAILEFFAMEISELLHCFSISNQNQKLYGGNLLDRTSKPKDVAENIFQYIEGLPNYNDEIHMLFTRRVIFEKTSRTIEKLKQPRKKL